MRIAALEALGEALLDFSSMDNLKQWFAEHYQQHTQEG